MESFKKFQRETLKHYIVSSSLAVFGVGSVFIFYTLLDISPFEITLLCFIIMFSSIFMFAGEILSYRKNIKPIKQFYERSLPSKEEYDQALVAAKRFPIETVKRILGPHLFGLSIPAVILILLFIYKGWIHLPYIYVVYACGGAILIATLHAVIEFFQTSESSQRLILDIQLRGHKLRIMDDGNHDYYASIKKKLLTSFIFTATFPILLFILASNVRLDEYGSNGYWTWAGFVLAVITTLSFINSILLYKSIDAPINSLKLQFAKVKQGHLDTMNNIYTDEFSNLVSGFNHMVSSIKERDERNEQLLESFFTVFAATLDARDPYTAGHSIRVAEYSVMIAEKAGISHQEIDLLRKSALLHDIGKIGIPDSVLLKEGKLTDFEFQQIKTHTVIGANILEQVKLPVELRPILPGIKYHHERYDGRGYPEGLAGEDIPLFGRIIAVADSYDAMTSDRPYRKGMPSHKARAILESGKGTQWDAKYVDHFLDAIENEEYQKAN
ncbi:chemotaxis protein CheY [Bacillus coahuilensis m2-6]|uniref:Chemotaxis protein CheY n=2 Tax=Bacillus coahuilensis TaxID=408580 RepID=A0A147KB02_9BACI|nr:HD domain-containing phosphohydrolase [Bacillus coahuilensis]KUP08067.1 chemotaxis protein CheY [Bacillus coahuilensis p1.1.43]KUP09576.1 chemotaxis protein CheY [Bacillus coahuilensis m2-6]